MGSNGISIKTPNSSAIVTLLLDEKEYEVNKADFPHSVFTIFKESINTKKAVNLPENGEISFKAQIKVLENGNVKIKLTKI